MLSLAFISLKFAEISILGISLRFVLLCGMEQDKRKGAAAWNSFLAGLPVLS